MKGIVLAGGTGSRLYPVTKTINKHLLPVYDKPMIFYPLSILMLAEIKEILIITTPQAVDAFRKVLGTGEQWGLSIEYATQTEPKGLAEAFIIGEKFIGNDTVALILGDNILYKDGLKSMLLESKNNVNGATVFAYHVSNPKNFGVVEIDSYDNPISIEEKPENPRSNYAVVGLYFYDNKVIEYAKKIKPSKRNELEITDINKEYLKQGKLSVKKLGRGAAWLDAGTPEALFEATQFIHIIEKRQGLKIADLDEIKSNIDLESLK